MPIDDDHMNMIILIFHLVYFVQETTNVTVHKPGEWSVLGSRHNPVQLSAITYVGNKHYIVSPSHFLKIHLSFFFCVDSTSSILNYSIAPND